MCAPISSVLGYLSLPQLEHLCLCAVLPSLDVTNVQHELNKLKLDPSYPLTEPLKAPTEDQPAPAGLRGINALFHKPWPVSQRAHAGPPMDTIAEDRESYSSGSSAAMSVGAMNSTAGKNLCATNLSLAIPTPFYLAKGDAFFNPFKPEAVQFMLSAVAGNPMPRVDESPPEPLEQSHIDVGMQVELFTSWPTQLIPLVCPCVYMCVCVCMYVHVCEGGREGGVDVHGLK